MFVQGMQGLPARIVKLSSQLSGRSKNVDHKCRQCRKKLRINTNICTKHSLSTNRTAKTSKAYWYHVKCAKALNII